MLDRASDNQLKLRFFFIKEERKYGLAYKLLVLVAEITLIIVENDIKIRFLN